MTPEVGQVWVYHCVGVDLLCLLARRNQYGSFDLFILEEGRMSVYARNPKEGVGVGEWELFA